MKLISWNMNQRPSNWAVLAELMLEHGADVAMVQEAVAPPTGTDRLRVFADPSLGDAPWRIPVPAGARRNFASAVAVLGDMPVETWVPKPLSLAEYSSPVISHPGQWVAVGVGEPEQRVWVVSLYGLWETMPDTKDIFAEATLHRALSDLALLVHTRDTERVVLAGDLNIWRDYGHKKWVPRYQSVFDRLSAYGLDLIGPHRTDGAPLEGCPCKGGSKCLHVRTYRHQKRADSTPYQTDFAFARGVQVRRCVALDEGRHWLQSDHCPILVEFSAV
jgi:hypothetical protein